MSASKENSEYSFETKAIYSSQICGEWGHNEIVPPIVTSSTFYLEDPTRADVGEITFCLSFCSMCNEYNLFILSHFSFNLKGI